MAEPSKKPTKRPGPQPRGPFSDKRRTLTTRITEKTRARLEDAAAASDRSLSQEIEFRLERSFEKEDSVGGQLHFTLLRQLANTGQILEQTSGEPGVSWLIDPPTRHATLRAWDAFLNETFGTPKSRRVWKDVFIARGAFADYPVDDLSEQTLAAARAFGEAFAHDPRVRAIVERVMEEDEGDS